MSGPQAPTDTHGVVGAWKVLRVSSGRNRVSDHGGTFGVLAPPGRQHIKLQASPPVRRGGQTSSGITGHSAVEGLEARGGLAVPFVRRRCAF
jgi:hypothetical protein